MEEKKGKVVAGEGEYTQTSVRTSRGFSESWTGIKTKRRETGRAERGII